MFPPRLPALPLEESELMEVLEFIEEPEFI